MTEQIAVKPELDNTEQALRLQVAQVGHTSWQEGWRAENGDAPRVKVEIQRADGTIDWINEGSPLPEGASTTGQRVDLAHTDRIEDLPAFWQRDNLAMADDALAAVRSWRAIHPSEEIDDAVIELLAADVHDRFRARRKAEGGWIDPKQDVEYDRLQDKDEAGRPIQGGKEDDRRFVRAAIRALDGVAGPPYGVFD